MFEITYEEIAGYKKFSLGLKDKSVSFSTIPQLGCCLFGLKLQCRQSSLELIKNWIEESSFHGNYLSKFPGSQLFPFPNRLKEGKYANNGKNYSFPKNDFGRDNALHGHIYDKKFKHKSSNPEIGEMIFEYISDGLDCSYPNAYSIQNKFQLKHDSLLISSQISNLSNNDIPIGHGWHPYFNIPTSLDKMLLRGPQADGFVVDDQLIPNGEYSEFPFALKNRRIDKRTFDTCFFRRSNDPIILTSAAVHYGLKIDLGNYNYFQIYTPTERNCIAIEPQSCAPNAFNNELGLIRLGPNETQNFYFQISLIDKNEFTSL